MTQTFQITVIFDSAWITAKKEEDLNPISWLMSLLQDELLFVKLHRESDDGCVIEAVGSDKEDVYDSLIEAFNEMGATTHVKLKTVKALSKPQESHTEETDEDTADAEEDTDTESEESIPEIEPSTLDAITRLVGASEFKTVACELATMAAQICHYKTWPLMSQRCYLFSMEDGCGFSTQISLLADLLTEHNLGFYHQYIHEYPWDLPLGDMLEKTNKCGHSHLLAYDLSAWMGKENTPEFRLFLRRLAKLQGHHVFVFRIPFVDKRTWARMYAALNDVFTIQPITMPPLTMDQLKEHAHKQVEKAGFSLSQEAWEGMEQHLIEEKSDGRFWGLNTVQKVVNEFLYEKQRHNAQASPQEGLTLLGSESVPPLMRPLGPARSAMEQFDALLGVEPIRQRVLEVVSQMKLATTTGMSSPCLHMRFIGNPGTGKTTVARIVGQLLKEEGLLSKGQFHEVAGRDLCGEYIGETAPKTAAICRDAYGSVLFIDEAYSLYRGKNDRDYGREAIDTLIAQMENHKEDLVIIMAGYEEEMNTLLKANPGLASRIPYTIEFPNYTREVLAEIFMTMASKSFTCDPELQAVVQSYFANLSDAIFLDTSFANARFVRNLFERTWGKASVRHQIEPSKPLVLCPCDFEQAAAQREFQSLQEKETRRSIGFAL